MSQQRPNRTLGGPHDEFWQHCEKGKLCVQRCASCHHLSWPPTDACEACSGTELSWTEMSGRATLTSWCRFERPYYERLPVPWDTILVALEEGPLMVSNPSGLSPAELSLGLPLRVSFLDCQDDTGTFALPVFERADR